jgi:hypothetical protein
MNQLDEKHPLATLLWRVAVALEQQNSIMLAQFETQKQWREEDQKRSEEARKISQESGGTHDRRKRAV